MSSTSMSVKAVLSMLSSRQPLPLLSPKQVWSFEISDWLGTMVLSPALTSTLLLWNDDLSGSHAIAQQLHSSLGSWIHGALHRREGDFANSKYWFRKTDERNTFMEMSKCAAQIIDATDMEIEEPLLSTIREKWDPFIFIDLCAMAASGCIVNKSVLEQLQVAELNLMAQLAAV